MAKSRVKSSEEYDRILGVNPSREEETTDTVETIKKTHDASRYFDDLREDKKTSSSNPFERVISVEEIRKSLRQEEDNAYVVETIKAEIANSQNETSYQATPMLESEANEYEKNKHDGFSFEENARKLYENLRDSQLNKQKMPLDNQALEKNEPKNADKITEIEPTSISKDRVTMVNDISNDIFKANEALDEVVEVAMNEIPSEIEDISISNFDKSIDLPAFEAAAVDDVDNITIAEEQVIETGEILENSINFGEAQEEILETNNEITNELDQQIDLLQNIQDDNPIKKEPTLSEKIAAEHRAAKTAELNIFEENAPVTNHKSRLDETKSDALTMALDQEKTVGLSKQEQVSADKPKGSKLVTRDRVITLALIIMIIVVIFLIWQTTTG